MEFNEQLFESVCAIWPQTSVRSFSKALGRSSGYWSSVKAQKLQISTGALMNLLGRIEQEIMINQYETLQKQMIEVKMKISKELIDRFVQVVQEDQEIMDELADLMKNSKTQSCTTTIPMPFYMVSY